MQTLKQLPGIFLILLMIACNSTDKNSSVEKRQYLQQKNQVKVMVLEKKPFKKELVSNGRLIAIRKSDLQFIANESLEKIKVKNGELVKKGDTIAVLNPFNLKQKYEQAKTNVKKTELEMQDILIGLGYNMEDSTNIPPSIREMAAIRAGYTTARQELKAAQYNLVTSVITAPFDGKIANIKQKEFEQTNTSEPFCTLIDDSEFEVEFCILEDELNEIKLKDEVKIIPFSNNNSINGVISEINPMVDENGLIKVMAKVKNNRHLIEGMNVKVLAEKEIPLQLVVPKSAVVLRQNQEVLFKYTKGIAFWTYVRTLYENSTSYSVMADPDKGGSLAAGDTVISSGNLNLAHESEVVVE